MNKRCLQLVLILGLALPGTALCQPDGPPAGRDDGPPPERREGRGDRERGDRERRGERDWGGEREPIPVELVPEALDTLRELHPEGPFTERLAKTAEEDPAEAAKHLGRYPRILELIEMRKNSPEAFALHVEQAKVMRETFHKLREYHEARRNEDQEAMAKLRPQIREKVERVFDLRIEMKQMEIERMKKEIAEAEADLEKIIEGKEDEIIRRLEEMLERRWGDRRPRRGGDDEDRPRDRERRDEDRPERG